MTTTINASRLHDVLKGWLPTNRHEALAECFVAQNPPVDQRVNEGGLVNLTPLPESEWPKWFNGFGGNANKRLYNLPDRQYLAFIGEGTGCLYPSHWSVRAEGGGEVEPCIWHPTPQAALVAAGLPLELLDGLESNDLKVPGVNAPLPEYDPDDVAFKSVESKPSATADNEPKLRVGQRVRHGSLGIGHIACSVDRSSACVGVVFGDNVGVSWVPKSMLTPIPPPLIDNGDGEYRMEGYAMAVIMEIDNRYSWRIDGYGGCVWSDELWDEPTEAAEDLWRRMEGIDR